MNPSTEPDPGGSETVAPLVFPDRLYGRDAELAALTQAFAEVGMGAGRVLLLPGHSGSGKTALVRTLRRPVRDKNGFFLEGKFNQFQQGVPLLALRQALRQLADDLSAAPPSERQGWAARVLEAVGGLGRLVTDLSPEWEILLGPQPAVPDISPYEAPHRFAAVLRQFLAVFCRAEHPVVLFVDDWQWADAASLAVLQRLQVNTSLRYLLVLAAYRDNEVDATHPMQAAVEDLRRQAVPLATLTVRDLSLGDVKALLADTLTPAIDDPEPLATFVHDRTRGNPFFVRALLESLRARRILGFDPARKAWVWTGPTPVAREGADDVVQLFVANLRRLPAESRDLLALAACLGSRFDLETLATVSEQPPALCRRRLGPPLEQGVIRPLDGRPGRFEFRHDRVQQAAHSLIDPDELPRVRLRIGRLLRERLTPRQLQERLLEVTDHLNCGRALLRDEAEQRELVELNIAAGRKARASTAYGAALQCHRVAGEVLARPELAESFWKDRHGLAQRFLEEWSESEFLEGDPGRAEACIREALAHARTPLEQAGALCVLILQNTLLARYPEAIAAGRRALAALGITLPESDFEAARNEVIARVRRRLTGCSVASLRDVPPMSDPTILVITRVLITLGPPCYRSHPRLWSVLVPTVVELTLQYGPVPQVGYSHTAFGGLLGWVDRDYATAREFGRLAETLMREVFTSPSDQSVFHLMIGSSTRHWFAPLRAASEDYARAWEAGLRSGNLQYAAYAFGHDMYCRFYQGTPLDRLIEESRRALEFSRSRTNQWAIDLLEGGLQVFGTLAGGATSVSWREATYLEAVDAHGNIQVACIYRVLRAFAHLVQGELDAAAVASNEAESLIETVGTQGLLPWPEHVFARLQILAALSPPTDEKRRKAWRDEMNRGVALLEVWAVHAPENYRFKLAMARAEIAGAEGRPEEALGFYEDAIEGARAGQFHPWEARANERAAQVARILGRECLALVYWQNAYFAYHRWGAMAKVGSMEREFLSSDSCLRIPKASRVRLEGHVEWLRAQAARSAGPPPTPESSKVVRELAEATEHLREEVARRKEVEAELERRRDELAREIEARTRDLEATRELARRSEAQAGQLEEQRRSLIEAEAATRRLLEAVTNARDRAEVANAALRESERKARRRAEELQTLMDLAPLAIWVAEDPECRRIIGNRAANALYEADHDENVSAGPATGGEHDATRRFYREGRELTPEELPMQRAVRTNTEIRGCEMTVRSPSGRRFTLLGSASPLYDEEGRVRGCIGCFVDITERKLAEDALRASEERFRTLVEEAPDGIFIQTRRRFAFVNAAAVRLFGATERGQLLGQLVESRVRPDFRAQVRERIRQLNDLRSPVASADQVFIKLDGSDCDVDVSAVPFEFEGEKGALVFARDIGERKRLERERLAMEVRSRQQQKLESLGTLASGVAHEINNPITGILNYAQLIEDRLPGGSPLTEFTGEIMRESRRIATIVRHLLTFARNERQSHSPARVADVVEGVLALVRTVIRHDRIILNVDVPEDLPPLNCRSQQIQQVIMNLVTNARDALNERYPGADPGKVLDLRAGAREKAGRRWIRITVEDRGIGIAPEVRERMFDPFFTTKGRETGTGLGLSISHGIVKEHRGEWAVESEPGSFTRMHVDLPVDDGPER